MISDLPTPSFVPLRYKPGNLGTWSGHLAFAHDLIAAMQPGLIVELGTHWGESYFTFCQSVFQNGIDCLCYAVDHWQGEEHAGFYGEDVFNNVKQYNDSHYKGFSYLLRTSFDMAAEHFADESIDLLHIDGLHTYEAVRHDFQTWFPKVKPGGIILMHDISVRHANFGVWRLWSELTQQYRDTFAFHQCWGLGVLRKDNQAGDQPPLLSALFNSSPAVAERLRRHYVMYTVYLEQTQGLIKPAEKEAKAAEQQKPVAETTKVQVYLFGESGYSEDASVSESVPFNKWSEISLLLPAGNHGGPLRIDPADAIAAIDFRRITLREEPSGAVLFSAEKADDFRNFTLSDSVVRFYSDFPYSLLSYSTDPSFLLPPDWRSDRELRLELEMRVTASLTATADALRSHSAAGGPAEPSNEEIARLQQVASTAGQKAAEAQSALAGAEAREREAWQQVRALQELLGAAEDRARDETERAIALSAYERDFRMAQQLLDAERAARLSMEQSKSWTITKPLRNLMDSLKR